MLESDEVASMRLALQQVAACCDDLTCSVTSLEASTETSTNPSLTASASVSGESARSQLSSSLLCATAW